MRIELANNLAAYFLRSWWPTWHEFTTHYIKEIGFLASLIQLMGATVFWMAGFTNLPGIHNAMSLPVTNGAYWLPQVVGGTGFIASSILLMTEVQDKWCVSHDFSPHLPNTIGGSGGC